MPNSWGLRLPGVTQRVPLRPSGQALRRGRGPEKRCGPRPGRQDTVHDPTPWANPARPFCGSSSPITVFSISPCPCFPGSLSVSPPRSPCATVPSDSSVHTRTERACSSHFPEFNPGWSRGRRRRRRPRWRRRRRRLRRRRLRSLSRRHGGCREPISGGSGSARVPAATTTALYFWLWLPSPLVLQ